MSITLDTSQSVYLNPVRSEGETAYLAAINPGTLLGRAYKLWSNAEVACKCPHHFNKPIEIKPGVFSYSEEFTCSRQRYWRLYCSVRDGKILTDSDKMLLGMA